MADFLCESCGYNLAGAQPGSLCPECGKPADQSHPLSHPGSRWQRSPGLTSWARTTWDTLFRPARVFESVSMVKVPVGLLALNVLVASALIAAPLTGVLIGDWARAARGRPGVVEAFSYLTSFAAQVGLVAAVLLLFTVFDVYALTLLGRTKSWRLTRRTAWVVCAHASAGWLLSGLLPLLFMANYYVLGTLLKLPFTGQVTTAQGAPQWSWQAVLGIGLPALGYLSGLVAFEVIALRGVRVCRFANPPDARPEIFQA